MLDRTIAAAFLIVSPLELALNKEQKLKIYTTNFVDKSGVWTPASAWDFSLPGTGDRVAYSY